MEHVHWMPHGICFLWDPVILVMWMVGNVGIWLCYTIIPIILFRSALHVYAGYPKLRKTLYWFSAFIVCCGSNHILHAWTVYRPDYFAEALMSLVTFAVSVGAILNLYRTLPDLKEHLPLIEGGSDGRKGPRTDH